VSSLKLNILGYILLTGIISKLDTSIKKLNSILALAGKLILINEIYTINCIVFINPHKTLSD
jgi:hypothetical protein